MSRTGRRPCSVIRIRHSSFVIGSRAVRRLRTPPHDLPQRHPPRGRCGLSHSADHPSAEQAAGADACGWGAMNLLHEALRQRKRNLKIEQLAAPAHAHRHSHRARALPGATGADAGSARCSALNKNSLRRAARQQLLHARPRRPAARRATARAMTCSAFSKISRAARMRA